MKKRFLSIWFRYLMTDWLKFSNPELQKDPVVFVIPSRGRKIIFSLDPLAESEGLLKGMPLADAKAIVKNLKVFDYSPEKEAKLLRAMAEWCIRYSPIVAIDEPQGLLLDISGCTHLWGSEMAYLKDISERFQNRGYHVRIAISDTPGAAWAVARYANTPFIVKTGEQLNALLLLPPEALRLESSQVQRLHKLGLHQIQNLLNLPIASLRRRFGEYLILKLKQALGDEDETITPIRIPDPYFERLPCLEPILTLTGVEIAISKLLNELCERLKKEGKGLRQALLKTYRVDSKTQQISIEVNRPTHSERHLFNLFKLKTGSIDAGLGIELFTLEAIQVEECPLVQETIWTKKSAACNQKLAELIDKLSTRIGASAIHRYLPDEHYWPERSFREASSLDEEATTNWPRGRYRPTLLLKRPDKIEVTAPIPDYPPMTFRYKNKVHFIKKADGPERIECEWWLETGEHRDYYQVEDELGMRYWIFRAGHYEVQKSKQWFIHGFFA